MSVPTGVDGGPHGWVKASKPHDNAPLGSKRLPKATTTELNPTNPTPRSKEQEQEAQEEETCRSRLFPKARQPAYPHARTPRSQEKE